MASTSSLVGGDEAVALSSDQEHSSPRIDDGASEEADEASSEHGPQQNLFLKRSVDEDFANNNDHSRRTLDEDEEGMETEDNSEEEKKNSSGLPFLGLAPASTNANAVADQLKNISLTISQLTSNLANTSSPKSVQELAVLQATLFSLQQQQLLHMQILAQMQQQNQKEDEGEGGNLKVPTIAELAKKMEVQNSLEPPAKPIIPLSLDGTDKQRKDSMDSSTPIPPSLPPKVSLASNLLTGADLKPATTSSSTTPTTTAADSNLPLSAQILDPNAPSSLASSIILHPDGGEEDKPVNSLELLQKRAQGILNSASQGLLANNLADFTLNKDPSFDKKGEPFFKHRCRYCGKVFGSDSALQIHVRSHTGERPYKCNVCGNRFTTKGNLKVHFQRHAHKFPNVKMNPNLVPEHLDKFYPPLLQLMEEAEKKGLPIAQLVNNPMAGMTPVFPPGFKLPNLQGLPPVSVTAAQFLGTNLTTSTTGAGASPAALGAAGIPGLPRFPLATGGTGLPPSGLFPPFPPLPSEPLKREDMPQNLSLQQLTKFAVGSKRSRSRSRSRSVSPPPMKMEADMEDRQGRERSSDTGGDLDRRSASPEDRQATSGDEGPSKDELSGDEQPENLSRNRQSSHSRERSTSPSPNNGENSPVQMAKLFPGMVPGFPPRLPITSMSTVRPPPVFSTANAGVMPGNPVDPAKDPAIYTNLLPRPGSTDNSWESLIEIEKSSETSKLEQLVNNIENKLSDPNECVICHRVLSCKSALQMHYRTHTGERPFKCRICSRAFTTKGNLKTHMGVHRAKPPMRMFHQCPVCHKKYANALVLQQHIRTHTGEPTELTAEQIAAAEIKDFPPLPPGHPLGGPLRHPASSLFPGAIPGYFPMTSSAASGNGSSQGGPLSPSELYDKEDKDSAEEKEDGQSRPSSVSSSTSSTLNTSYPITSIPSSMTDSLRLDQRPFGLVRPLQMDKLSQILDNRSIPEDLSSRKSDSKSPLNGRKDSSGSPAVSPPKFSPEPPTSGDDKDKERDSPAKVNGLKLPMTTQPLPFDLPVSSPSAFSAAAAAAAFSAAALDRTGGPPNMMFPGFPGLLPPSGSYPGSLPPASAASIAAALAGGLPAGGPSPFNPLGLPLPGSPMAPSGRQICKHKWHLDIKRRSLTFEFIRIKRSGTAQGSFQRPMLSFTRSSGILQGSNHGPNPFCLIHYQL